MTALYVLVDSIVAGDPAGVKACLRAYPELASQCFNVTEARHQHPPYSVLPEKKAAGIFGIDDGGAKKRLYCDTPAQLVEHLIAACVPFNVKPTTLYVNDLITVVYVIEQCRGTDECVREAVDQAYRNLYIHLEKLPGSTSHLDHLHKLCPSLPPPPRPGARRNLAHEL